MFTTRIRRLRQELTTLWPRREEITSDVASSITDSVLTAAFNDSTMSSSVCASDVTDSAMTTQDTNNNDDDDDDDSNVDYARLVLVTILFCIVVFTAVGNFIVLISPLYERRLRTTLIYFILNLALTDFLVAIMAMDFYTIEVLLGTYSGCTRSRLCNIAVLLGTYSGSTRNSLQHRGPVWYVRTRGVLARVPTSSTAS